MIVDETSSEQLRHNMFERRLHALVVGVVLLVAAATLGAVIIADPASSSLQGIDDRWLRWMISARTPWLTRVAKLVSAVGSVMVTLPLRLVVSAMLAWRRRWLQLGAFVGATPASPTSPTATAA